MKEIKVQWCTQLLAFFLILSFPTMADTVGSTQIVPQKSNQQAKQAETKETGSAAKQTQEADKKDAYLPTLINLRKLINHVQERSAKIEQNSKELVGHDKEKAEEAKQSIDGLQDELKELNMKLESVATGIAIKDYRSKVTKKFNLAEEAEKLLQPMIYSLNAITQDSREIEELKQDLEQARQQEKIAITATSNLKKLVSKAEDKAVKIKLEELLNTWQEEKESLSDDAEIISRQLDNKLQSKVSVLSSTGEMLTDFFKNRGVNFILGIFTFFAVFFMMRFLYFLVKQIQAKRKNKKQSTFARLIDLIYRVLTILVSILATLFIFNLRNDWLLLGIGVIFLVAIGWALIKAFPAMVEQLMMLLNLGSVREGDRLIFNGVPWKVERLHLYTHLVNPDLSGGSLHLPVRQLVGLVSRPAAGNEEWFPTDEEDWVKMDDSTIGQVIYQSPEMVQVRLFGGNQITYTTENYLALSPMNLSHGYRIQMVFGIDYKYQAECTTTIPKKMTEAFRQDLIAVVGEDNLVRVVVDFFLPNTSSLDFEYEVFLKGSAAYLYEEVERTMIYSFANVCNENGWEIPFQQITLHQAKA